MSNITKEFGKIKVDEVKSHTYKESIDSAQIRQEVITRYPSMSVGNSLSESLFGIDEYGLEPGQEYKATRVTWLDVPKGTTAEQVEALLAANPNACIYGVYSNKVEDVMTDQQKAAVAQEIQTLEFFEDKLRIRDNNGNELEGPAQYRQYGFSKTQKADIDLRTFKGTGAKSTTAVVGENAQQII